MPVSSRRTPSSRVRLTASLAGLVTLATGSTVAATSAHSAALTAPAYLVVTEGLTKDDAARLADSLGIGNALRPDGSFGFVDAKSFQAIPRKAVAEGVDEKGNKTLAEQLDLEALHSIRALPIEDMMGKARELVPVPKAYDVKLIGGHTSVEEADAKGNPIASTDIDTSVSFQLSLGGVPVVGPGAKIRISFGPDGAVTSLNHAARAVEPYTNVPIITPDEAQKQCATAYGKEVALGAPTLAYYAQPLAGVDYAAIPKAKLMLPHYLCHRAEDQDRESLTGRLVPATTSYLPKLELSVTGDGTTIKASVARTGGRSPFSYRWTSSTTDLLARTTSISFTRDVRRTALDERLSVEVTDANGIVVSASVVLPGGVGSATAASAGRGGVGGEFATYGIESTVSEWPCAMNSSNGFRSVMSAKGQSARFDWRGDNAWERDFADNTLGGIDNSYADNVDSVLYTGHGWPGGFTFNTNQRDTEIVPGDARWGNKDLEWLNLESCQVLRDTTGTFDHFGRWGQVFQGLHLMNGFHDNAACTGVTGERFAKYLFPETVFFFFTRDALTVQQAWAQTANEVQPAGRRYRTMSPVSNGVSNLGDYYWGQGATGPDIRPGAASFPLTSFVSISGVS